MITIFRKIRQKLAYENRFNKYFRYAFGEIILVAIGILIALQVNNWNGNRKELNAELQLYSNLLNDLNSEYNNVTAIASINRNRKTKNAKILIQV